MQYSAGKFFFFSKEILNAKGCNVDSRVSAENRREDLVTVLIRANLQTPRDSREILTTVTFRKFCKGPSISNLISRMFVCSTKIIVKHNVQHARI